jgi:hypothetical protein
MKALLITIVLAGLMALLGWLTFANGDGSASVTIDTDKVKSDTAAVVEKGKELAKDGVEAVRNATDDDSGRADSGAEDVNPVLDGDRPE